MTQITSNVIHGDAYGRTIGFPTANLDISPDDTGIVDGIYAAYAHINGESYKAALVINRLRGRVEVHLIDQQIDLYDSQLTVHPQAKVGDFTPIDLEAELIAKIQNDIEMIREELA